MIVSALWLTIRYRGADAARFLIILNSFLIAIDLTVGKTRWCVEIFKEQKIIFFRGSNSNNKSVMLTFIHLYHIVTRPFFSKKKNGGLFPRLDPHNIVLDQRV